jgi:hypothetical protein
MISRLANRQGFAYISGRASDELRVGDMPSAVGC